MFNLKQRYSDFRLMKTFVRCYSFANKSHYDVLNLKRNCTDKDIKAAFIKMSKEYHPDKNNDPNAQQSFVRIVEAYNVLSKPGSRAQYDQFGDTETVSRAQYRPEPFHPRRTPNYDYYYKRHEQSQSEQKARSYYGVRGLRRLPNYVIILLCFGFAFIGSIMQAIVIREMYVVNRRQSYEKSKRLAEELDKVRSAARLNTNEMQTRILMEKIVSSANPTIATASLGQALANEKKEQLETFLTEFGVAAPPAAVTGDNYAECQGATLNLNEVLRKAMLFYNYYRG